MAEQSLLKNISARLQIISDLISREKIRSQKELAIQLENIGVAVAQPTLSRDLDDLAVTKDRAGFYCLADPGSANSNRLRRSLRELLISVDASAQMIVLRTPQGGAHLLASAIDQTRLAGVLGTIAGDDTILLITSGSTAATDLVKFFINEAEAGIRDREE